MKLTSFELGLMSIIAGSLILLYALNILTTGMNFLVIGTAVSLIAWGLYSTDAFPYIQNFAQDIFHKIKSIFHKKGHK